MIISKKFTVEIAHFLPRVPTGHKCANIHGHSIEIEIVVNGDVDPHSGWVIDFAVIKKAFEPLKELMDHRLLNDISGLSNPTSENLCIWLWAKLIDYLPLYEIIVRETRSSECRFKGSKIV